MNSRSNDIDLSGSALTEEIVTFLQSDETARWIERMRQAAAIPLSIHYVTDEEEYALAAREPGCAACRHVTAMAGGGAACRGSRLPASLAASRRKRSVPFQCHMGFACLSAPVLPEAAPNVVLTLGPYCPAEAPEGLEADVRKRLANFTGSAKPRLPFSLGDVRTAPAGAMAALADWATASFQALWREHKARESGEARDHAPETAAPEAASSTRRTRSMADVIREGGPLALALAAGDAKQARALFHDAITETEGGKKVRLPVRRGRALSLAGELLEGASRAGFDVERGWDRLTVCYEAIRAARNDAALVDSLMEFFKALRPPKKRTARGADKDPTYKALHDYVTPRLAEGVTLDEAARAIGQNPTAITHRLQRKFGLSFSQYVGRLRVQRAKELLRRTKLPVNEVAKRVGVNDPSNLGRLFRKFEGVSPQEYRLRRRRSE
ncbi:MAG: helix-turn-helix domain-containing protein [Candidatus Hydrogenedentota bacterium]